MGLTVEHFKKVSGSATEQAAQLAERLNQAGLRADSPALTHDHNGDEILTIKVTDPISNKQHALIVRDEVRYDEMGIQVDCFTGVGWIFELCRQFILY